MPHIFPRRFLRGRDVLDPYELNQDLQPAHDLVSGNLDRTNFSAPDFKTRLRAGPNATTPEAGGPYVAEGAYFTVHTSQIESRYPVYNGGKYEFRAPPNFVKLDGATFRGDPAGTDADAKPFVVPNNGAWTAVENADLSAAQQITFTSGETKVWISAYAQYVWQGFYEYKSPYVSGTKKFASADYVDTPDVGLTDDYTWAAKHGLDLPLAEMRALNRFYPSETWEALPSETTANNVGALQVYDAQYAWPLNEGESAQDERVKPNLQGYHHISKGYYPCLVQFALRVDGKIIEETITGRQLENEESSHGMVITDSPPVKSKSDSMAELMDQLALTIKNADLDRDDYWNFVEPGQRTIHSTTTLEPDSAGSVPGQKLKSSRASACGPEVMPVRLGAVVSLEPGPHTIELVVRRLQRKKGTFETGNYVGVFSRRMVAFELPIRAPRQANEGASSLSAMAAQTTLNVPTYLTEDKVDDFRLSAPRTTIAGQYNALTSDDLKSNILTNEYLPSKVTYSETSRLLTSFQIDQYTGEYTNLTDSLASEAVFPGWHDAALKNNVLSLGTVGWRKAKIDGFDSASVGWYQLNNGSGLPLGIVDTTGNAKIQPGEKMILFMDVEIRNIAPIYSKDAESVRKGLLELGPEGDRKVREQYNNFVQYLLAERYLDLFALVAIGYRQDGSWNIMNDVCPAMVNNFNWVNRGPLFTCNGNDVPYYTRELRDKHWWDADLGWNKGGESRWADSNWLKLLRNTNFVSVDGSLQEAANSAKYVHDGRGDRLFSSNLGINIPIMQVIENTGTTELNITEFGGFISTYLPSSWCSGVGPKSERIKEVGGLRIPLFNQWASPAKGRNMLDGIRVRWGQARLTAIKVTP